MHKVFGIRNNMFAKMLFNWLSGNAEECVPLSYKLFLKKILPLTQAKNQENNREERRKRIRICERIAF
jgi:hypothetical protein